MTTSSRPLLAAAVIALACSASWAQSGNPGPASADAPAQAPHRSQHAQTGAHSGMHERMRERMSDRHAKAMEKLKSSLQLQADQTTAWDSFTQAMQPPSQARGRPDRASLEKLTTPERMERMQTFRAQRDTEMQKRQQATRTFYASLNAEQKKVFDQQTLAWMQGRMGAHGQPVHHRTGRGSDHGSHHGDHHGARHSDALKPAH